MKKFFLWWAWMCCCFFISNAQGPNMLNKYRAVFVPPLYYEKDKSDIYGIRQTVVETLSAHGVPVVSDEHSIPGVAMRNPCSILHCMVNNSALPGEKGVSMVSVLFFNCSEDTVLSYFAKAKLFLTFSETRNSFISAAQKALEIFNQYQYQFADSAIPLVQPAITDNDSIQWSAERKLGWDDFKGTATDDDPADALTYTANQTLFESFGIGNRFDVESHITCYFVKSKSWVKSGKQSDYLLNHEQRHFDLAEVGAREFRNKLKATKFTQGNFSSDVKRITEEMNQKYHKLQQQYDRETDHSRLEEKQQEWNKKVDGMLKDTEAYK